MPKMIEDLTDEDLQVIWPAIGGAPHLFDTGKDELRQVLVIGDCGIEYNIGKKIKVEPIGLQLDFYTMAAIVDILRHRGFETADVSHYF